MTAPVTLAQTLRPARGQRRNAGAEERQQDDQGNIHAGGNRGHSSGADVWQSQSTVMVKAEWGRTPRPTCAPPPSIRRNQRLAAG